MFDPITLIGAALSVISSFGNAGEYIAKALSLLVGIPILVSALVAFWHSVVLLFAGIAKVFPGVSGFAGKLKAWESTVDSGSNVALNWIDRLSAIKIPQKK